MEGAEAMVRSGEMQGLAHHPLALTALAITYDCWPVVRWLLTAQGMLHGAFSQNWIVLAAGRGLQAAGVSDGELHVGCMDA